MSASSEKPGARRYRHPMLIAKLFLLCGVFTVLPLADLPFIGLSITAPLMLPIFYYAFLAPAQPWRQQYRSWLWVASGVWVALGISFLANGSWLTNRTMDYEEFASLWRYLYWLLVFGATAWVATDIQIQRQLAKVLAVSVVVLAFIRCFEGFALGKVGAWSNTVFITQNNYGILFSTFSPFLFPILLSKRLTAKIFAAGGLLTVLYACAINGSRGSWVCISVALAVFLVASLASRPLASVQLILPLGLTAAALLAVLGTSGSVREAFLSRFETFQDLEQDKSYMTRQVMNQRSLRLFENFPWFGVGPGRYRNVYVPLNMPTVLASHDDADFNRKSAHNSYLCYLAEGGIIGSLPLALLLGLLFLRGAPAAIVLNRRGEAWALGVYASLTAMSLHLWALSGLASTSPWFVYGLVVATVRLAKAAPGEFKHAVAASTPRPHQITFAVASHRMQPMFLNSRQ